MHDREISQLCVNKKLDKIINKKFLKEGMYYDGKFVLGHLGSKRGNSGHVAPEVDLREFKKREKWRGGGERWAEI